MVVRRMVRPDEIVDVRKSCKIPESLKNSPLSKAKKHLDFQVTV